MWEFKLTLANGQVYYYDSNELPLARIDKDKLGGTITDKNGKEY
jgi:hypothetical protein